MSSSAALSGAPFRTFSVEEERASIFSKVHTLQSAHPHHRELIGELEKFPLGRCLLLHGGIDAKQTDYLIKHDKGQLAEGSLERQIFDMPIVGAMRERAAHFTEIIQREMMENGVQQLASLPCGYMSDLLDLDFSGLAYFELTGIDISREAIEVAQRRAEAKGLELRTELLLRDAWYVDIKEQFGLLASNGFALYIKERGRVEDFYRICYRALKPGGLLVTSFLTPPSEWDHSAIDGEKMAFQKLLVVDIAQCGLFPWPEREFREMLQRVGFEDIHVHYDTAHLFPTVTAKRPW